jgi:hypothetical protein
LNCIYILLRIEKKQPSGNTVIQISEHVELT